MILGDYIHEFTLDNHEQINTDVIKYLYDLKKLKPNADKLSNRGGWQKNHLEKEPQM